MGALAIKSAVTVHRQLAGIYRHLTGRQIWHLLGFTMLPGIDDYPGKTEVTSVYIKGLVEGDQPGAAAAVSIVLLVVSLVLLTVFDIVRRRISRHSEVA